MNGFNPQKLGRYLKISKNDATMQLESTDFEQHLCREFVVALQYYARSIDENTRAFAKS